MRLQWRLVSGAASSAAAWLLWPTAALAGNCPWLINCTGGNVKVAGACAVGAAFSAALCLPGGEWRGDSDDFGGGGGSTTAQTPAPISGTPIDGDGPNVSGSPVDPNVDASPAPEILTDNAGGLGGGLAGIGGGNNNPPQPNPSPQPGQPQPGGGGGGAGGLIDGIGGGGGPQPGPAPGPSPQPSPDPAAAGGGGTPNPNPSPSPGATPASPDPSAPAALPVYRDKDGKLIINMTLGDPEDLKNLPPASTPDPSSVKPAPSPTPSANPAPSPSPGPTPPGPKPKTPLGGLGGD